MTELAGINADRISTFAWMLSSLFAGLAGVLLAPLFSQVNNENFLFLLIAAMAAAAFGSLQSIPMTLAGGIALGIGYQLLYTWLPAGSILSQGLRPALPFGALFLLLLFWPGLRNRREAADPLAGVDPPPPAPAATLRTAGHDHLDPGPRRRGLRLHQRRRGLVLRRLLGAALHHRDRLRRHLLLDHRHHGHGAACSPCPRPPSPPSAPSPRPSWSTATTCRC